MMNDFRKIKHAYIYNVFISRVIQHKYIIINVFHNCLYVSVYQYCLIIYVVYKLFS